MNEPLLFRRAQADDAAMLTAIAFAGKQSWGYPEAWIAEWRHDLVVTPEYIRTEPVQVAELAGEVVGFVGLSSLDGLRYLEHLWQWPRFIGRGFGRALFEEGVRVARREGGDELHIRSDPNAETFYLRMGAVRIGAEDYLLLGQFPRRVPQLRFLL
jgi:GNAT superfamily N-acetyltransferase